MESADSRSGARVAGAPGQSSSLRQLIVQPKLLEQGTALPKLYSAPLVPGSAELRALGRNGSARAALTFGKRESRRGFGVALHSFAA